MYTSSNIILLPLIAQFLLHQQREEKERAAHSEKMAELAKDGVQKATRRNNRKRRELWFDMLPPEQQQRIIRRKEASRKSFANKRERDRLVHCAMFHRWLVLGWMAVKMKDDVNGDVIDTSIV